MYYSLSDVDNVPNSLLMFHQARVISEVLLEGDPFSLQGMLRRLQGDNALIRADGWLDEQQQHEQMTGGSLKKLLNGFQWLFSFLVDRHRKYGLEVEELKQHVSYFI